MSSDVRQSVQCRQVSVHCRWYLRRRPTVCAMSSNLRSLSLMSAPMCDSLPCRQVRSSTVVDVIRQSVPVISICPLCRLMSTLWVILLIMYLQLSVSKNLILICILVLPLPLSLLLLLVIIITVVLALPLDNDVSCHFDGQLYQACVSTWHISWQNIKITQSTLSGINIDSSPHVTWPLLALAVSTDNNILTTKHSLAFHYKYWIIPISILLNNLEVFKRLQSSPCYWAGATTEVWRTRPVVLSASIDLDETFHSTWWPDVEVTCNRCCNSLQQQHFNQCAMTRCCLSWPWWQFKPVSWQCMVLTADDDMAWQKITTITWHGRKWNLCTNERFSVRCTDTATI